MAQLTEATLLHLKTKVFSHFIEVLLISDIKRRYNEPQLEEKMRKDFSKYIDYEANERFRDKLLDKKSLCFCVWKHFESIKYFLSQNINHPYFHQVFDGLAHDASFIQFIQLYGVRNKEALNLTGEAFDHYNETFCEYHMAVYHQTKFRFDIEQTLKAFLAAEKNNPVFYKYNTICQTERQKIVCAKYVQHYLNRLPLETLPELYSNATFFGRLMNWIKW